MRGVRGCAASGKPCSAAAGATHGVRPNGTSSRRAQEQLTTAAPARATSAASAGEMTLCAIGVRLTPPCAPAASHAARCTRCAAAHAPSARPGAACEPAPAGTACCRCRVARPSGSAAHAWLASETRATRLSHPRADADAPPTCRAALTRGTARARHRRRRLAAAQASRRRRRRPALARGTAARACRDPWRSAGARRAAS